MYCFAKPDSAKKNRLVCTVFMVFAGELFLPFYVFQIVSIFFIGIIINFIVKSKI